MEIRLTLTKHCIETTAKKTYERLIKQYLRKTCSEAEKQQIEATLERLKYFLEHADFPMLRSTYPELGTAANLSVTLDIPQDGQNTKITFNGRTIHPEWKKSV